MNATPEWMKDMNQDVDDLEAQEEQDYAPPEPEQPPEAEPEEPEHSQQQQTVPLATLIEERKRLQEQLAEERARASRFERLEDEIRRVRSERAQQQPQPQATQQPERPPVDYLEDPKGYVDSTREELIDRLKRLEGTTQQTQQAAAVMAFERQVRNALGAAESSYVEQQPDYYDALNYVRSVKQRELGAIYPQAQPEQIQQILTQQEIAFGAQMLQQGVNPSAQAYKMAQALGYQAPTAQNQDSNSQAKASGSGVDRRRLQGMGGAQAGQTGPDSELERLMAGDSDEFDQALAELFGKQRR